jgi:hypothetical protein
MTSRASPAQALQAQGRLEHAPRTVNGTEALGAGMSRVVLAVRDGPTLAIMMW